MVGDPGGIADTSLDSSGKLKTISVKEMPRWIESPIQRREMSPKKSSGASTAGMPQQERERYRPRTFFTKHNAGVSKILEYIHERLCVNLVTMQPSVSDLDSSEARVCVINQVVEGGFRSCLTRDRHEPTSKTFVEKLQDRDPVSGENSREVIDWTTGHPYAFAQFADL
jgi:hypothetical protein